MHINEFNKYTLEKYTQQTFRITVGKREGIENKIDQTREGSYTD